MDIEGQPTHTKVNRPSTRARMATKIAKYYQSLAKLNCVDYNKQYEEELDNDEALIKQRWEDIQKTTSKKNGRLVFKSEGEEVCINLMARLRLLTHSYMSDSLTCKLTPFDIRVSFSLSNNLRTQLR